LNDQKDIATMNLSAFEHACLESRRLASLSECLQDHMEDRHGETRSTSAGIADPDSDLLLSLVGGIYGAGGRILQLIGREMHEVTARETAPAPGEDFLLAAHEMLLAVAEVSGACEQLRQSSFAQEFALPDFSHLVQLSDSLKLQLQRAGTGSPER
jgi:hypothetical protein